MLIEKILNQFEKKAKQKFPVHANRVSSIGFPCTRMCVYSIIRWQDRQLPTPELQAIFNEGNHQESAIKLDLLKAGIEINESQTEVSFPDYRLFGHIDGSYTKGKKTWAVEFKSISEHLFKAMNTADDFINSKFPHHRCYIPQLQLYMFGRKLKSGLLILKNKNSGWLKEIEVKLDKTLCQFYLDKCTRINKCVDESKIILHETYQIKEIADFDKIQKAYGMKPYAFLL